MYLCIYEIPENKLKTCLNKLNEEEIKKTLARDILEQILKDCYQVESDDIIRNHFGKPILKRNNKIYFNFSYSDNYVIVAAAKQRVGVDVEELRTVGNSEMTKVLSKNEQALLEKYTMNGAERDISFLQLLTAKESYFKHIGTGVIENKIKTIESQQMKSGEWQKYKNKELHSLNLNVDLNCIISVCVQEPEVVEFLTFEK